MSGSYSAQLAAKFGCLGIPGPLKESYLSNLQFLPANISGVSEKDAGVGLSALSAI